MAVEIPDLWGDSVRLDVITPAMLLNSQATALTARTQGLIRAQLTAQHTGNLTTVHFDALAPAAGNRRRRLFSVRHERD